MLQWHGSVPDFGMDSWSWQRTMPLHVFPIDLQISNTELHKEIYKGQVILLTQALRVKAFWFLWYCIMNYSKSFWCRHSYYAFMWNLKFLKWEKNITYKTAMLRIYREPSHLSKKAPIQHHACSNQAEFQCITTYFY